MTTRKVYGQVATYDCDSGYGRVHYYIDTTLTKQRFHLTSFHPGQPVRHPVVGEHVELIFDDDRIVEVRTMRPNSQVFGPLPGAPICICDGTFSPAGLNINPLCPVHRPPSKAPLATKGDLIVAALEEWVLAMISEACRDASESSCGGSCSSLRTRGELVSVINSVLDTEGKR